MRIWWVERLILRPRSHRCANNCSTASRSRLDRPKSSCGGSEAWDAFSLQDFWFAFNLSSKLKCRFLITLTVFILMSLYFDLSDDLKLLINKKRQLRPYFSFVTCKRGWDTPGFSADGIKQGKAVVSSHWADLDLGLRISFSECNTDSQITSLPLASSRTPGINALDGNAQWVFTLKLITLSSVHSDVGPHCNVM